MLAEAYIENNEMRVINFPKDAFIKSNHWKINIEPIEEMVNEEDNSSKLKYLDDLLLNIKHHLNSNVKNKSDKELLLESLKGKI
jgi:hypothetical protein